MTRLGLFGGTFDPVHYGHLRAADAARRELELDRILVLPNPLPPHKMAEPLTPYVHRKEMLRRALVEFTGLELAEFEEQTVGPAYTTDTVRRVIASLPREQREIWLIVGMDSLIELPHWKDPEALFRDVQVAGLPRPGFDVQNVRPDYLRRVRILYTPLLDISAREIRSRIRDGHSVDDWLPASVLAYIRTNRLYL
ncbi:nicotinate-nucleotide adenylyltransferase [bacterium]|nr:nicotinate-nucleotide adenylyltransferase [bacterium]MBU1983059.1 nicotinate-nucleotide adenylyltransferase [bacterium]